MYGKIFNQIFASSIAENYEVRHVFMDLIVLADADGVIDMTPEYISAVTRVPVNTVLTALTLLTAPDPNSRTSDEEGRRLVPLDPSRPWGWRIVNHQHYRAIRDNRDRKAYMAKYMRVRREGEAEKAVNTVNSCKQELALVNRCKPIQKQKHISTPLPPDGGVVLPEKFTEAFRKRWQDWVQFRTSKKKCKNFVRLFAEQIAWLSKFEESVAIEILSASIRNDWQGLFEPKTNGATRSAGSHQIAAVEEAIAKHPANSQFVGHNPNCSQEEKDGLKKLRAKLAELKGSLIGAV